MRDIVLEETIYLDFTTRSFATGVPTVLAGTPVLSVLEENSATPITAGVSVSVDRASVVGLNMATIVATAANGYENGKGYSVYISTGTVGGVSVVGEKVGEFTIGASAAAQDLANGTDGLGAIKEDTAATLLDTAEIGTAGAGLTDLGGMSTAMKAEVNAECDTALTDYDGPTNTEMNARTLPSASYFDPAADTVANVTTVATTTDLTNLPSIPANWLTAAGIAANALDGKGDWNIGKTGYSLTQAFPTNFADMAITVTTGLLSVGTNNDKTGYSISGTITTLDGLNNFDPTTDAVATVATVTGGATAAALAAVDSNVDAILVDTGTTIPATLGTPAGASVSADIAALNDISVSDILTTAMTEAYAADGVAPTLAQAIFLIQQTIGDFSIAGTTITTKKLDGSTTAATYTLDDGTNPTSRTRTT